MKYILQTMFILLLSIWITSPMNAQSVLLDKGVQVEGLWCFPVYGNEKQYRYLPTNARLAIDQDSLPKFSFMRYIMERESTASVETIGKADGGGILHFLVLYETPQEQIDRAAIALRELMEDTSLMLKGPVLFDKGRYNLISSILKEDGEKQVHLLSSGEAPILENSQIALAFNIDPLQSKLLLESFKMNTPDLSLLFELGFSGYSDVYEAELTVNWEEVRKNQAFSAGGSLYYIGADVELGLNEMRKEGAITLSTNGNNEPMESLVQAAYQRLTELLFEPVEMEKVPAEKKEDLLGTVGALIGDKGLLASRQTTGFGLGVAYKRKELQTAGQANLSFKGRMEVHRNHLLTFNIGNLHKAYGNNPLIFRDIALDDPVFQQRTIHVGIDGQVEKEFEQMVSGVTLLLKKVHGDSTTTTKELLIDKHTFRDSLGHIRLTYLNRKDTDRLDWLSYEYQTIWQFEGGGIYKSEWISQSASMINLYVPFRRKTIYLEGIPATLTALGVRNIYVEIAYPFFGTTKEEWGLIRDIQQIRDKKFQITLPNGQGAVDYNIFWFMKDGTRHHKTGQDVFGLLFLDELPTSG